MPKIRHTARFSFSEATAKAQNGPVVVKSGVPSMGRGSFKLNPGSPTQADIRAAVEAKPGASAGELGHLLKGIAVNQLAARLLSYSKATTKPWLKRVTQDGKFRYYPINYKLGPTRPPKQTIAEITAEEMSPMVSSALSVTEPVETPVETKETVLEAVDKAITDENQRLIDLEQILKDYLWEAPGDVDILTLKSLLTWYKDRELNGQ